MTDRPQSDAQIRRRWINLGEFVAVAGLVISGLALWNSWGGERKADKAAPVEQKVSAVPLALRGTVSEDGKVLTLAAVEDGHALDSLTLNAGERGLDVGSDGAIAASSIQSMVGKPTDGEKSGSIGIRIEARYIEAGKDKRGRGNYRIRYRWENGGLFSGRKLRITGFSRG